MLLYLSKDLVRKNVIPVLVSVLWVPSVNIDVVDARRAADHARLCVSMVGGSITSTDTDTDTAITAATAVRRVSLHSGVSVFMYVSWCVGEPVVDNAMRPCFRLSSLLPGIPSGCRMVAGHPSRDRLLGVLGTETASKPSGA